MNWTSNSKYQLKRHSVFYQRTCRGACGQDLYLPPPPPLVIFVCSDDHICCLQNIKPRCVLISIYMYKKISEINGFLKSEFAAHITVEGWQLHLEKAFPSWKTSTEKLLVCVGVVVVVVVNFSNFPLLLQTHWINFNQIWHKVFLVRDNSSLFKWRALSFSQGR